MITQSVTKIYLSEQRGIAESDWFRTYSTFNFGNYYSEHRFPFGDLYVLNDDSLAGGQSLKMHVEQSSYLILLPIVGALSYHDNLGNENLVNAGNIQIILTGEDYHIELANPYEAELINFLQIWIKAAPLKSTIIPDMVDVELDQKKNTLISLWPVFEGTPEEFANRPRMNIGKFAGRSEAVYKKNKPENSLFAFVIEGAFEVNGRLLHPRDGLSLSDEEVEMELEALSNDAIIFIVELNSQF